MDRFFPFANCIRFFPRKSGSRYRRYSMAARTVGIGHQDFEQLIQSNLFYIDKTDFIR